MVHMVYHSELNLKYFARIKWKERVEMIQFILSERTVSGLIWGSRYTLEKKASKKAEEAPFLRIHMFCQTAITNLKENKIQSEEIIAQNCDIKFD